MSPAPAPFRSFRDPLNLWFSGILLLLAGFIWLNDANQVLFLELNAVYNLLPAPVLGHLTALADVAVVIMLSALLLSRPGLVVEILLAGLVTGLIVQGMKYGLANPRPAATLPIDAFELIGPALASSYSFPSGHSATIMVFIAPLVLAVQHHGLRAFLILLAVIIASGRIAVGAHWPLDVIFGVLIAWWIVLLLHPFSRRLQMDTPKRARLLRAGFIPLIIFAGWFHDTSYDTGEMQFVLGTLALLNIGLLFFSAKKKTRHP